MDEIEKQIELKAPLVRVWRALTDHREFGAWVEGIPAERRFEAMRGNDNGWTTQMKNIAAHVEAQS